VTELVHASGASDRTVTDHDAELEQLASDPLSCPEVTVTRHAGDQLAHLGAQVGPATAGAGHPAPEQSPALPMPAHDSVGRDQRQVFTPAITDPQQLVAGTKPSLRSSSSRTRQNCELVPEQQVLGDEVLARAGHGPQDGEQEPEEFDHVPSIADLLSRRVLPPDNPCPLESRVASAVVLPVLLHPLLLCGALVRKPDSWLVCDLNELRRRP